MKLVSMLLILALSNFTHCSVCNGAQNVSFDEVGEETKFLTVKEYQQLGLNKRTLDDKTILNARAKLWRIPKNEDYASIEEKQIGDFNGDGKSDIFAVINRQCSSDPAEFFLIFSSEKRFVAQSLGTEHGSLEDLVDLDGDGKHELLVAYGIMGNTSHAEQLCWIDVYSWTSKGFVENSKKYVRSFYIPKYLPILSSKIDDAEERLKLPSDKNVKLSDVYRSDRLQALSMLEDCRKALEKLSGISTTNLVSRQQRQSEAEH